MTISIQSVTAGNQFDGATAGGGRMSISNAPIGSALRIRSCRFHTSVAGTSWTLVAQDPDTAANSAVILEGTVETDFDAGEFYLPVSTVADSGAFFLDFTTVGLTAAGWLVIDYVIEVQGDGS